MYILVPWKPVVLVWGLLSGMILVGFVASSLIEGKNPFVPYESAADRVTAGHPTTHSAPEHKHKANPAKSD